MDLPPHPPEDDHLSPEDTEPVEVPFSALSAEVLQRLVESFVLREGTDYGAQEFTHDQKVAQVIAQLKSGEARILYDPATESVTLLPKK